MTVMMPVSDRLVGSAFVLRFRTFGTIDLRRVGGERIDSLLQKPKMLALFTYLAERHSTGPVRREELLSLLWPDSGPSSARHALSSMLTRLRNTLGQEVLLGRGEEAIALSPEQVRVDVVAFRTHIERGRPGEALDLYRGPFLHGFRLPDAREYLHWVEERRSTYRRRAQKAGLEAADGARREGDMEAAERCLRRAADITEYDEEVTRRLVRVLVERGKKAAAVQVYRDTRRHLERELGLSPSEALEELVAGIRSEPES